MSSPLVTGDPDMELEDSAKLMINKEIKRLPIVEEGRLVGIVTFTDLIKAQPQIVSTLERSIGPYCFYLNGSVCFQLALCFAVSWRQIPLQRRQLTHILTRARTFF